MPADRIRLGNFEVGKTDEVYFIAEIGINHNGELQIAKRLIDAAFACGWQCAKFQKREPDIAVPDAQKTVIRDTPWGKMTYLEYKKRIEFGSDEYDYISKYCKEKPIAWTASVWDLPSLNFLLEFQVPFLKIPSAKNRDFILVKAICQTGLPVIASTGMSHIEEIDDLVNILEKYTNGNYILMHTNSAYPSPTADVNLRVIELLKKRYQCIVGYSGHEYDIEPSVAAAVLGAQVIERHVTISHDMWGTDQFASLEVHAMDKLRKRVINVMTAMGDGEKRITIQEMECRKKLRG